MSDFRKYTRRNLSKVGLSLIFENISITTFLIVLNVLIFLVVWILKLSFIPNLFDYVALKPADFVVGNKLWTIFTSMFMHANLAHLFFNMFSLFFIGNFVEKIIGRKRFFIFYLISGLFAGGLFAIFSGYFGMIPFWNKIFGDPFISGVGASGAIFGLLGLLALLTPKAKVYLIVGPLIALIFEVLINQLNISTNLSGILSLVINIYFIISILAIFSFKSKWTKLALPLQIPFWSIPLIAILPLIIVGFFVDLPIGNIAHFGGFVSGFVYGIYLRKKYPNKIKLLSKHIITS
ncbi:MAG TPA: rhomboid family intramembrane serine protease [Candidatus Paceibacterota bacterium]|nr:rhomboid family intramembrane serine protease [Candidatus Paceibacterota bacterium]